MSDKSKLNKQSSALADEAADRAIARRHIVTKATEATTGEAGLATGDKAKGKLANDPASDLKPRN